MLVWDVPGYRYWPWKFATSVAALLLASQVFAAPLRIGFLASEASLETMGPHNRGAWETARTLGQVTLLLRQADGTFADSSGAPYREDAFDVLWYHQGDAIARNAMYRGPSLNTIRRFAESGRGVLLSGGALSLVSQLQLESEMRPQRHDLDNHRDPAGLIPHERSHPVFTGFQVDGRAIGISHRGCRAVADFYWGGPGEGMVLAKTPAGAKNPLVEYALGKGRVIVFGWRWPDYEDVQNPYRKNLLRLTENLLRYLAEPPTWQSIVIRSEFPPVASPGEPGISQQQWRALRMAIEDLSVTFGDRYPRAQEFSQRLAKLNNEHNQLPAEERPSLVGPYESLATEALLANPLLDFDRLLMIRRRAGNLGLPLNFHGNSDLPPTGYDNSLVQLQPVHPGGNRTTVFVPDGDPFIGDLELHYDGNRLLMSMPDAAGRWGVVEYDLERGEPAPVSLIEELDVHNYDACYLPDGRIVFTSTAPFTGVPCVGGKSKVANLYLRGHDGSIRRLTHDQDHNWCPTVLNNGRLLYQRWEYADIAHAFTRLLFHANPDGSRQMEYYGSNSFWPTSLFYARPVPNHPTKVVAIVGGHHEAPRQGEMILFDPARGRHEADGVVQRIPGYGQPVQPFILDGLIGNTWPRFLHPYPLSEKYFLVSCKPTKTSLWGIYLVDVFDNFVLLAEEPGYALLEPTPVHRRHRPPQVPDVVEPAQNQATVMMTDVYHGSGLTGIPRGAVKALRLVSYEFTFHDLGGEPDRVGFDGPWDVKRILGTVPVESDGSAHFTVPACTPVAVQPLDEQGKAMALMRSWFSAAPGEVLSCVGCHEPQNSVPPHDSAPSALLREPSSIRSWYGPPRGFSFVREVQPVLDAYCIECHDGSSLGQGQPTIDLTDRPIERVPSAFQMHFTPAYTALRRFVHTPTLESDAHLLPPRAFHADTSKLVQILRDDHYGVTLNNEAWDRLITWIDLNAPAHGSWAEAVSQVATKSPLVSKYAKRRRALHQRYAGIDEDPEAVYETTFVSVKDDNKQTSAADVPSTTVTEGADQQPTPASTWPSSAEPRGPRTISLAKDVDLELVYIPPGTCVMGSDSGYPNEQPAHRVSIQHGFWMSRFEITNRQFACFDPAHDSGLETGEQYQFGDDERGHDLNRPEQPVVRVSWHQARAFCHWLSERAHGNFNLPTESQWEYACRAGSTSPLWYGTLDDDFSASANLSDATHHTVDYPHVPNALPPWRPADTRYDDRWRVSAPVGTFAANRWQLCDMHGNVSEWTRSTYRPYPYQEPDGRNDEMPGRKTVRGGSWLDRPRRARSAFRLHFESSQAVHDVGFRLVCEE